MGIRKNNYSSIARAISIIEDEDTIRRKNLLKKVGCPEIRSHIVGITGPPGIGKSTLIGNIASVMMDRGRMTSVLAIDASSPFTGGSLLGNRIRMQEKLRDSGIFMRSLANRGEKGGLSRSALGSVKILEAAGNKEIIIETVGSGQADLDIMNLADTIVLVLAPGLGDEIQAIKAGIMEISDIFVINKMDREGSYFAIKDIEDIVSMDDAGGWKRPVIGTTNQDPKSYDALIAAIESHKKFLEQNKKLSLKRKYMELEAALEDEINEKITSKLRNSLREMYIEQESGADLEDPYSIAEGMLNKFMLEKN
ncbi:ArgK protein [mine drainage metagenome]|uniref:ArgK protein n=2 Tax=mine drainage metagenome TaxID=410659 RepID=T0YW81_9ZZZZ